MGGGHRRGQTGGCEVRQFAAGRDASLAPWASRVARVCALCPVSGGPMTPPSGYRDRPARTSPTGVLARRHLARAEGARAQGHSNDADIHSKRHRPEVGGSGPAGFRAEVVQGKGQLGIGNLTAWVCGVGTVANGRARCVYRHGTTPPEPKATGSNPVGRATFRPGFSSET